MLRDEILGHPLEECAELFTVLLDLEKQEDEQVAICVGMFWPHSTSASWVLLLSWKCECRGAAIRFSPDPIPRRLQVF